MQQKMLMLVDPLKICIIIINANSIVGKNRWKKWRKYGEDVKFFLWYEKMFNVKHFLNNVPEKQDILRIIMEVLICIIKR